MNGNNMSLLRNMFYIWKASEYFFLFFLITNSTVETISITIYLVDVMTIRSHIQSVDCHIFQRISLIFWLKWIETRRFFNRLYTAVSWYFAKPEQILNWMFQIEKCWSRKSLNENDTFGTALSSKRWQQSHE